MGNSEVGHLNIGAGRIVKGDLLRISEAIADEGTGAGRDMPPRSAIDDLGRLAAALPKSVAIATISGRYYAMDRDHRWERVVKAYDAIAEARGPRFQTADAVIADSYARNLSDEFVMPAIIDG